MGLEIRLLTTPEELEEVVSLEMLVGGLPERHVTSPITLKVLTLEHPRVGWLLGAFQDGKLVGFSISFFTRDPEVAFGFMLAVDPSCQDGGTGAHLLRHEWDLHRANGVKRVCWTYEPLEARNAHLYLNKMGANGIKYVDDYYYLHTGLHAGLPQDRLLVEVEMDKAGPKDFDPKALAEALDRYPVARAGELPETGAVLVEVPHRIHELLPREPKEAERFRMESRAVFKHYVNQGDHRATGLFFGDVGQGPQAFYLLEKV